MGEYMNRNIIKITSIVFVFFVVLSACIIPAAQIKKTKEKIQDNISSKSIEAGTAIAYMNTYDKKTGEITQEPLRSLTVEQAYQLHDQLLNVENTCSSSREKILMQINILKEWGLLSHDFSIDEKIKRIDAFINQIPIPTQTDGLVPNVIVCGPAVTSFLTIGGPIIPLHVLLFKILPPFWYNTTKLHFDTFNGTRMVGFLGALPATAFYCTAITFINAYGAVIGEHTVKSPFISLSVIDVLVGLSIAIFDDGFPINIFDWLFGVSLTGLIAYIDIA
jgi:hypothetical protein